MALVKLALSILASIMLLAAEVPFDYFAVQRDVFAGFSGNFEALERAIATCEAALAAEPKNSDALVLHGVAMIAQTRQHPDRAAALMAQGLAEMDRAAAMDPGDLGVRIPRGAVSMAMARSMPESPMRQELLERGRVDFQYAFDMQSKAKQLDTIGTHPLGELLQGLGDVYSRLGKPDEARKYYQMVQAKLPDTEYAKRATQWMMTGQPLPTAQSGCVGCHVAPKQ
jgi:tetratricopeptide (TPR) repeat protein